MLYDRILSGVSDNTTTSLLVCCMWIINTNRCKSHWLCKHAFPLSGFVFYRHQKTNVASTNITALVNLAVMCGVLRLSQRCSWRFNSSGFWCCETAFVALKISAAPLQNTRKFTPKDIAYIPEDLNCRENNIFQCQDVGRKCYYGIYVNTVTAPHQTIFL